MKRLFKIAYFLLSIAASAHAPVEHFHTAKQGDVHEVRTLIMSFRRTGNDEYLEAGLRLLQPELNSNASAETLLTYAFLSQSRHQFDLAQDFIKRSIAMNPRNNEAYLLQASINLVVGNNQQAKNSCAKLNNAEVLITVTCYSRVALANNQAHIAYPKLAGLLTLRESGNAPAALDSSTTIAWAESVAGDLAQQANQPLQAINHYRRSLALNEQVQVKAALADVMLANQQPQQAVELIDHHETALPLLIRRLIGLKRLTRVNEESHTINILNEAFTQWIAEEDWLHAREMSRFYLDVLVQPALAKMLATRNIEIQKEPEDILLLERTSALALTSALIDASSLSPIVSSAVWEQRQNPDKTHKEHASIEV